ncbi:MAG: hypothetical protein Ct9H300mP9_4090 [Candidatus Neomarinimicrobiota bacterium]|nr:MAG: hypothetical protein Ct9H300mP9_4090 [Candidatus Neomarinimicrobiota bacterium]
MDNIQVAMVDKVEVITNPSAKYDPDGVGGIINIVLKRGAFDGLNGSITTMAGEYDKRNIAGNVNYRTDSGTYLEVPAIGVVIYRKRV